MAKKTYCELCGKEEVEIAVVPTRYNKDTGEKKTELVCPDVSCVRGCEQNGGHRLKRVNFWAGGWNNHKCVRCGEDYSGSFY